MYKCCIDACVPICNNICLNCIHVDNVFGFRWIWRQWNQTMTIDNQWILCVYWTVSIGVNAVATFAYKQRSSIITVATVVYRWVWRQRWYCVIATVKCELLMVMMMMMVMTMLLLLLLVRLCKCSTYQWTILICSMVMSWLWMWLYLIWLLVVVGFVEIQLQQWFISIIHWDGIEFPHGHIHSQHHTDVHTNCVTPKTTYSFYVAVVVVNILIFIVCRLSLMQRETRKYAYNLLRLFFSFYCLHRPNFTSTRNRFVHSLCRRLTSFPI